MTRRGENSGRSPAGPIEKEHRKVSLACTADGTVLSCTQYPPSYRRLGFSGRLRMLNR